MRASHARRLSAEVLVEYSYSLVILASPGDAPSLGRKLDECIDQRRNVSAARTHGIKPTNRRRVLVENAAQPPVPDRSRWSWSEYAPLTRDWAAWRLPPVHLAAFQTVKRSEPLLRSWAPFDDTSASEKPHDRVQRLVWAQSRMDETGRKRNGRFRATGSESGR